MGIFDFFKSSENKNKNKENNVDNEIKINNHQINKEIPDKNININVNKSSNNDSEPIENDNYADDFKEISYYDEFGKEFKMPKKDWLEKKLYPSIKKYWNNMDGLYPIIQDAFSKEIYPEIKEAVLRFYASDENFERKLRQERIKVQ